MKRTAGILLKVQKILSIIELVAFIVIGIILFIVGVVGVVSAAAGEGTDEAKAAAAAAAAGSIAGGIVLIVLIVLPILAMVFTNIAIRALNESKTRAEARKGAIFAIVAGAITELIFGIPAGIIMLVMKDEDYNAGHQEAAE